MKIANEGTSFEEGTNITFTIMVTDSTKLFDKVESSDVTLGTPVVDAEGVVSVSFVMPDKNVSITVTLKTAPVFFNITKDDIVGGSITISATSATEGDVIEVNAVPDETHVFSAFTSSVEGVTFTTISATKASFVMPAADIKIGASFTSLWKFLEVVELSTGFFDSITGLEVNSSYLEGTKVSGNATLKFAVSLSEVCIYVNDVLAETSLANVAEGSSTSKDVNFTFTVPSESFRIFVDRGSSTIDETNGHVVTVEPNANLYVFGVVSGKKYSYVSAKYYAIPGYKVSDIGYLVDGSDEWKSVMNSSSTGLYIYGFTGDITIKAVGELTGTRAITYENGSNITVQSGSMPTLATVGEKFSLRYTGADGFHVGGAAVIEGVESPTNDFNASSSFIEFIVPAGGVDAKPISISFSIVENGKITAASNELIKSVVFKNNSYGNAITSSAPGDSVYIFATAVDGYAITETKAMNGDTALTLSKDYSGNYYFSMPSSGDVVVSFTVAQTFAVTTEKFTDATEGITNQEVFSFSSSGPYAAGATVNFTVNNPSKFYSLASVTDNDTTDPVTIMMSGNSGSFVMPARAVALSASFTKIEGVSVALLNTNLTSSIKRVSISGSLSNSSINYDSNSSTNVLSAKFLPGESLYVSISFASGKDNAKFIINDGTKQTFEPTSTNNKVSSYNITAKVTTSFVSFDLEAFENTPLVATIDNKTTTGTLSYKVDNADAADLNSVYSGLPVMVSVTGTPSAGHAFSLSAVDSADSTKVLSKYVGSTYVTFTFTPTAAFTVILEEVALAKVTIVDNTGLTASDGSVAMTAYVNYGYSPVDISSGVLPGTNLKLMLTNNYSKDVVYSVTMADSTSTWTGTISSKGSAYVPYQYGAFSVTGDVAITITLPTA